MELRVFVEPQQGASYDDLLRVAQHAEDLGFDGFFRSDHYLFMGEWAPDGRTGEPGPTDAWTTLGALARETTRLRLGTLVTSATFRLPGILAIQVANVDAMSGGRVELGLGAGWFEEEHAAYGIPFPSTPERFDRLEEQLAIVTGLWATPSGERFSYDGKHYRLIDSPALPKPVQSPPPIIVGGHGKRRTPALAARYAAEFNVGFSAPDDVSGLYAGVRDACRQIGRDPADLVLSVAHVLACGTSQSEVTRRADEASSSPAELSEAGAFVGSPAEVVDRIGQFAEAGATRLYVQFNGLADLEHLDLIASEVMPQLT
jgi:F420-dependent oxidoreductase-like protein